MQLWDRETCTCVAIFEGRPIAVTAVTFSLDGAHLQAQYYGTGVPGVWDVHVSDGARKVDWNGSSDNVVRPEGAFSLRDGRVYVGNRGLGREHLVCLLPPNAQNIASCRLLEGVDVVAVGCGTGHVVLLHVQSP